MGFYTLIGLAITFPQYLFDIESNPFLLSYQEDLPVNYLIFGLSVGLIGRVLKETNGKSLHLMLVIFTMGLLYALTGLINGNQLKYVMMEAGPLAGYVTVAGVVWMIRTEKDLSFLLRFIFICCALASLGAIIEYINDIGISTRYYVQGRSAKGLIGAFIGITAFLYNILYPELKKHIGLSKIVITVLTIINILSAVLTINRTMLICYALLFLPVLFQIIKKEIINVYLFIFLTLCFISIHFLSLQYNINPALIGEFSRVEFTLDEHRIYEYSQLSFIFTGIQNFILGAGSGTSWYRAWSNTIDFSNHNFYIQLVWKFGVIGIILFLYILFFYLKSANQRMTLLEKYNFSGIAKWSYLLMFMFLVISFTMNRLVSPKHVAIIGVILGLPFALENLARNQQDETTQTNLAITSLKEKY